MNVLLSERIERALRMLLIARSALKYGVKPSDIVYVHGHAYTIEVENTDPRKWLYLGFTPSGIPLELVSLLTNDGTELVIHAMRQRKKYHPARR